MQITNAIDLKIAQRATLTMVRVAHNAPQVALHVCQIPNATTVNKAITWTPSPTHVYRPAQMDTMEINNQECA